MDTQSFLHGDLLLQIITTGRLASITASLLGLSGVIIGRKALMRSSKGVKPGQSMGIAALVLGLIGVILGITHLASTTGGFGTGKGRAGAIVALLLGLTAIVLGALTLRRSQRIANRNSTVD